MSADAAVFVPRVSQAKPRGLCQDPEIKRVPISASPLSFFCCNARSLKNKLNEFYEIVYSGIYNIISVTETWLNAAMTDGLLDPKSLFHVYRRDRSDGYGGVRILVNKLLTSAAVNISFIPTWSLWVVSLSLMMSKNIFTAAIALLTFQQKISPPL